MAEIYGEESNEQKYARIVLHLWMLFTCKNINNSVHPGGQIVYGTGVLVPPVHAEGQIVYG